MPRTVEVWLRRWLYGLNLTVLAVAVGLAAQSARHMWFILLFIPLALMPFSYARWRTHRSLHKRLPQNRLVFWSLAIFAVVGASCDAIMMAQLLTARSSELPSFLHAAVIGWIGAVWFSSHALFLLGLGLVTPLRRLRRLAPAASPHDPQRRLVLQQMGIVGVAAPFAISLSGVPLSYDFRVEEREVVLKNWPRQLDGLRVVHLSDIHVGGAMNRERLTRVAELTNAAHPDLVLHTGDFLTHRSGDFDAPLYSALQQIKAPLGQWASLGNHDFEDPERLVQRLAAAGVTTLRNRTTMLDVQGEPLELAGIDFQWSPVGRADLYANLMRDWQKPRAPRLLLNHDPSTFSSLPENCADLVCSGHTHGGHVGIQLGPDHALTVVGLLGIPDQGVFDRDAMRLFVTRCVGFYGYPMRLGIPPEIAVLVLRSA